MNSSRFDQTEVEEVGILELKRYFRQRDQLPALVR